MGTELKVDSIGFPTDLVAKYTPAPRDEDEPQSLDMFQALAAESARAGAVNTLVDLAEGKRAQETLRDSEERFRRLFDTVPAGVFVCSRSGVIQAYNARAAELWGRRPVCGDPNEIYCGSLRRRLPNGEALPQAQGVTAEVLRTGEACENVEVIIDRPDGSQIFVLVSCAPLKSAQGEVNGSITSVTDITDRKRAEEALRESEGRLSAELAAAQQLQRISIELVHEQDVQSLYAKLVDAAATIMRSNFASMQMLDPERGDKGELRLLAARGFSPQAIKFWEWVRADSGCACGMALRTRERAIATDVETCDFMAGTQHLATYLRAGIHATQSTPLLSRSGHLLGMLSTHWREPHEPSETDLQRFDVLARQAADLIERAQAETVLRESEQRFRALVDASAQIVWTTNVSGEIEDDSPSWRAITGQTFEECKGFGWLDAFHPGDREHVNALWQKAVAEKTPMETECRLRHTSGDWRWTAMRAVPLLNNGAVSGLVGMNTDITRRKEAERSAQQLAAIVESSNDAIVSKDLHGIISSWNPGAERLFGYTAEEAIGRPVTILIPPERRDEERVILEQLRRGERIDHYETIRRRKDGSLAEISLSVSPIRDSNGKIIGGSKIARDISDRKRAEEELRESEDRFRAIVDQATAGIAQTDLTGRFELVNERYCEITGYSRDELLRMRMQEITHPEDLPRNLEFFQRMTAEGVPFVIEKRYLRKDGSVIWISNTVSITRDGSGRPQHMVAISLDISERRRAQEQQRLLLREMNHRIKNLFALAGGVVTLSARSADTPNDLAKAVSERLAALARAHELTLPGVTGEKAHRPATLPVLVRAIISPLLEKERVIMNGPDVPISGNAVTSLALLLQEFATNAAKYGALASETGRIEISWCEWKGELLLVWREQGGPSIDGPPESENEGFGSTLARLAVTGQLGGKISRDWDKEGLTIKLSVPLDRLAIS